MKLNKILFVIIAALILSTVFAGCSKEKDPENKKKESYPIRGIEDVNSDSSGSAESGEIRDFNMTSEDAD